MRLVVLTVVRNLGFLGYNVMWTCRYTNPSEKHTACLSGILVSVPYKSTSGCSTEDQRHGGIHTPNKLIDIAK